MICIDADIIVEEVQLDISFLSFEETYTSILLIHIVLYYTSIDHVYSRG